MKKEFEIPRAEIVKIENMVALRASGGCADYEYCELCAEDIFCSSKCLTDTECPYDFPEFPCLAD